MLTAKSKGIDRSSSWPCPAYSRHAKGRTEHWTNQAWDILLDTYGRRERFLFIFWLKRKMCPPNQSWDEDSWSQEVRRQKIAKNFENSLCFCHVSELDFIKLFFNVYFSPTEYVRARKDLRGKEVEKERRQEDPFWQRIGRCPNKRKTLTPPSYSVAFSSFCWHTRGRFQREVNRDF